jgi:calcineurin-like phosphoesterase family protein
MQPTDVIINGDNQEKWSSNLIKHQRAKEMTDAMIANYNRIVQPDDLVYHLGDFAFGQTSYVINCLRRLNGKIKFIWGNHDDNLKQVAKVIHLYSDLAERVSFLGDYAEIGVEGQGIVLMHYSMRVWNKSHRRVWQLYGHSHGSLPDDPNNLSIDVGVDCHNYLPLTFQQLQLIMNKKSYEPIDHHGE